MTVPRALSNVVIFLAIRSRCLVPGRSGPTVSSLTATVAAPVVSPPVSEKIVSSKDTGSTLSASNVHPLADPVLSSAGYHSFKKVHFERADDLTEFDYAVLAKGDTEAWGNLRNSFRYSYGDVDDVALTEPFHYIVGLFAVCDDVHRRALFNELAAVRNRLKHEIDCTVLACIFFAEPDPDEYYRLYDELFDEHDNLVLQDDIDAHDLLLFRESAPAEAMAIEAMDAEITAINLDIADERAARVAAEADLAEEQAARAAAEDRIRAAVERLQLKDDADAADILAALKGDSSGAQD